MLVVTRRGFGLRLLLLLLLVGLGSGMLGTMARAQSPARSQEPPPPAGPPEPAPPPPPGPHDPPPLDAPRTGAEALPPARGAAEVGDPDGSATRTADADGIAATPAPGARVYVPKEPPPLIAERASGERPNAEAVWTPGYWEWNADGDRFVWVAGSWHVPPAGTVWVPGRWMHDAGGWYWIPGAWGRSAKRPALDSDRPAWQMTGPPAEHPDDTPPPAPGPDTFYIAGHYAPTAAGDRVAWVPGFWADVQPGWDWIPARWVRRPEGWNFRTGRWIRDPAAAVVVERVPRRVLRRGRRNADVTVIARDPITGAEVDVQAGGEPVPDGAVGTGAPYYVIRPPGAYPYGPNGVVVPGTVPPFVRRMLDRVLP